MFSAEDAGGLAADLLRLLKEKEISEAVERVEQARLAQAHTSYVKRSEGVAAITKTMFVLKRQREEVWRVVEDLPDDVRLDAEHSLLPLLQEVFDLEIARLRAAKRRLSR